MVCLFHWVDMCVYFLSVFIAIIGHATVCLIMSCSSVYVTMIVGYIHPEHEIYVYQNFTVDSFTVW